MLAECAVAPGRNQTGHPSKPNVPWRERPFLPLNFAAALLGLSPSSLYKFEAEGSLAFKRLGGRTLVVTTSLARLVEKAEDWTPSQQGSAAREKRKARARAAWQD